MSEVIEEKNVVMDSDCCEQGTCEKTCEDVAEAPKEEFKPKRDIIRFNGARPTAINLEHVTVMYLEAKRITFEFYSKAQFVDFDDEAGAKTAFDSLLATWSSHVLA